jgi:hypothetical protein
VNIPFSPVSTRVAESSLLFIKIAIVLAIISTALLLDSIIRNSVCTPAKLPCRRVVEG